MPFDPNTLTSITINGIVYTLEDIGGSMRLPGNRAYVCRLKDNNNQQYALKYYNPHTAAIIAAQVYDLARSFRTQNAQLYDFPAFNWTKGRIYIDASNPITRTYSELTHAILMPWIHGELISNIRTAVRAGSKTYSTASVRKIVNNLLESLIQLERNHLGQQRLYPG
jgi:virulence-associated protein VapD